MKRKKPWRERNSYYKTEAYRIAHAKAQRKWQKTAAGRKWRRRYQKTDAVKAYQKAWRDKRKAERKRPKRAEVA